MTTENIDNISWDILDKYFNKSGSNEACNPLVNIKLRVIISF